MSSIDLASFNCKRAELMMETLHQLGAVHFCISPGSRSTPLALAVGSHPKAQSTVHFDERGLGFYALGLAKAKKAPVVIIATTGTAIANLFPAIMEAHLSRVPLILLSADRPPELRDCGANQTADQIKIFSSCTRWETDLAFSDPLASDAYLISTLSHAVHCAVQKQGPVQVNCMIREPFISLHRNAHLEVSICLQEEHLPIPSSSAFEVWGNLLSETTKGVLLLGSDAIGPDDLPAFLQFAEKLGWPIFSDILSGGRRLGKHPLHIEHFELLLKAHSDFKADVILQIGNRFVSKTLLQWVQKQDLKHYFLVTDHEFRQDPLHKVSRKMQCKTKTFCMELLPYLFSAPSSWTFLWQTLAKEAKPIVDAYFLNEAPFSEPFLFASLKEKTSSFPIFLSNSMPVRDADLLFYPEEGTDLIFCNRGVSGIDGNVATVLGIAEGLKRPVLALLGDLASLHDLNSFSLASQSKTPVVFIIINNQGGGIFSFLPVAQKKDLFEEFIATSHSYSFASIADFFSLSYLKVQSVEEWEQALAKATTASTSLLIECCTQRHTNVAHHEDLYQKVKTGLCSFIEPLEALPQSSQA